MAGLSVRVRMYRQGLGDCFLISFVPLGGTPFYMLIDCGVIVGTSNPDQIMGRVAADIKGETGGRIDLVVATHEHWDHLSGYSQAKNTWDEMEVGEVWAAWTEDPNDALGQQLRGQRQQSVNTLRAALAHMSTVPNAFDGYSRGITELLGFFGIDSTDNIPATGAAGIPPAGPAQATHALGKTRAALDYILKKGAKLNYRRPGEDPISLPGVYGIRIYVLGPPHDAHLITTSDPSNKGDVYGFATPTASDSFLAALTGLGARGEPVEPRSSATLDGAGITDPTVARCFPFDSYYQVTPDQARKDPFFASHYGFDAPSVTTPGVTNPHIAGGNSSQSGKSQAASGIKAEPTLDDAEWRRIDHDWMSVASELALNLDSNTNNTSLVLAIEFIDSGKVFLFPADAQYGNIFSWGALSWPVTEQNGQQHTVTGADLLARTVLYKVGHHGSHNATLKGGELELMNSSELVAIIPVNRAMAQKKRWNMPLPQLLTRLQEKARGRVLLDDEDVLPPRSAALSDGEWNTFSQMASVQELWVDLTFEM